MTSLDGKDLPLIAKYISSERCKNVFVMVGAGISTSAGIPDFRSPETGLYANLERLNLPYPEAVFDIGYFRRNPVPFYTLAKELAPGKFRPTLTHSFIRLLHEKKLLHTCFTQNIDCLERSAGVPPSKLVEAHGSFASHACIDCHTSYPDDKMQEAIEKGSIPRCARCKGLVKPNIVFFGESLPPLFTNSISNLASASLLIIIGTSLTVHPFASLTSLVPKKCPRLLINLDKVGNIGSRRGDAVILGDCDNIVRKLCVELGWETELDKLWNATATVDDTPDSKETTGEVEEEDIVSNATKDDRVAREVESLTEQIDAALKLSEDHVDKVTRRLAEELKEPIDKQESVQGATDASEERGKTSAKAETKSEAEADTVAEPSNEERVLSPTAAAPGPSKGKP